MLKVIISLFSLATILVVNGADYGRERIKKLNWDGIEVVWLQDDRFPTYRIIFYFADGAIGDGNIKGLTSATLSLIKRGTRRFNYRQIMDNLEFYGVSASSHVTHEYSTYSISGLTKDIAPSMKKICHLFHDATYPTKEVVNYKKQSIAGLKSLINSHGSLASRASRQLHLRGTPVQSPVGGKLADIAKLNSKALKKRLDYLNQKAKKRLYLYGPKSITKIKSIILKECGWNSRANSVRKVAQSSSPSKGGRIYLVTVPKANQAQINIGRFLRPQRGKIGERELHGLTNGLLSGGLDISLLMEELRQKRGLIYSASSYSGFQRDYGRTVISTETKNENLAEVLKLIKRILQRTVKQKYPHHFFTDAKSNIIGAYPFAFVSDRAFLSYLQSLDHQGKKYNTIYNYPKKVDRYSKKDVAQLVKEIFAWEKQTIVVLGVASLRKELEKLGSVTVINYQKFL